MSTKVLTTTHSSSCSKGIDLAVARVSIWLSTHHVDEGFDHHPLVVVPHLVGGLVLLVVVVVYGPVARGDLEAVEVDGLAVLQRDDGAREAAGCQEGERRCHPTHELRVESVEAEGRAPGVVLLVLGVRFYEHLDGAGGPHVLQHNLLFPLAEREVGRVGDTVRGLRSHEPLVPAGGGAVESHDHVVSIDLLAVLVVQHDPAAPHHCAGGVGVPADAAEEVVLWQHPQQVPREGAQVGVWLLLGPARWDVDDDILHVIAPVLAEDVPPRVVGVEVLELRGQIRPQLRGDDQRHVAAPLLAPVEDRAHALTLDADAPPAVQPPCAGRPAGVDPDDHGGVRVVEVVKLVRLGARLPPLGLPRLGSFPRSIR
mmetsp:Transcript_54386/g.172772  ORF Transcript_54386/g.172772 Transcript_54386/m.172772 type:complete len:369 (-) Transcript_54386:89-1195(-)